MYGHYSRMYSQWCNYYDADAVELNVIKKYASFKGKDILDIGCGTGRFMFRLLPYVNSAVGVDNDEQSIAICNEILTSDYAEFIPKTKVICSSIEDALLRDECVDIAYFSWSLYALDKEQMQRAISNVYRTLRPGGSLFVLQPTGGEFEDIMRKFFTEHEDKDEYKECLDNMNSIIPSLFDPVATDTILSHFDVPDLHMFCEMLKMFAVTEGGCSPDELSHISVEKLYEPMKFYKKGSGYCLRDDVSLFVFKKREVKDLP